MTADDAETAEGAEVDAEVVAVTADDAETAEGAEVDAEVVAVTADDAETAEGAEVDAEVVAVTADDAETAEGAEVDAEVVAVTADDAETAEGAEVDAEVVAVTADDAETAEGAEVDAEVVAGAAAVATIDPDELAAIQKENAALKRQLAAQQRKKTASRSTANPLWRKILVGALVVIAVVALVASVSVVWVTSTIQDEDQFVATLEPLPQQESVASVIAIRVADEIVVASGVEAWVREQLPTGLEFLAVPVVDSIGEVIAGVANEVIVSDAFRSVWSTALRATHRIASAVISGNDGVLESEGGVVSVNLDEIAGMVTDKVESTGLELPETDIQFGSIVLYEDGQLAAVQSLIQAIDTLGWFLPLSALVFIAAAIWLSRDRRRTTAYLGFGTAIGLALSLIALAYGRNYVVDAIEDVDRQQAAGDSWDMLLIRLYQMMWAALILALIVGIVAWVVGPSTRAANTRAWASETIRRWRQPAERSPNVVTDFVAEWRATIEVVVVVVGILFILFGPSPTGFSVLLTAVVVLAVIVLVEVLAVPEPEAPEAQDAEVSSDT